MITEIRAPKTGLTAETLTIKKWHKKEGEAIEKDKLLFTIETEKTTLDIDAPRSGYLIKIITQEGETVSVSQVIGLIGDSLDEQIGDIGKEGTLASPVARTMAKKFVIDLSKVQGTGPNGRIQKSDIEIYLKLKEGALEIPEKKEMLSEIRSVKETLKISPFRRTIAQKTLESKTTVPHYYIFSPFDLTKMLIERKKFEQSKGIKLSIDAIFIKVCALALEGNKFMNACWDKECIKLFEEVRIGFVVDTEEGIMIPHLTDPHKKSLTDIERHVQELAEKARKGRLSQQELESGSLSISNLGMYSIEGFIPIIYPGEVSMIGLGRVEKSPIWKGGKFIPRDVLKVTLSIDHRVIDGAKGAIFLQDLKEALEGKEIKEIFR